MLAWAQAYVELYAIRSLVFRFFIVELLSWRMRMGERDDSCLIELLERLLFAGGNVFDYVSPFCGITYYEPAAPPYISKDYS